MVPVMLLVSACFEEDLLDKAPITSLSSDNALQTEADMVALTNAAYDPLQWQVIQGAQTHMYPVMFQDIRADNCASQWASFWAASAPISSRRSSSAGSDINSS